MHPEVAVAIEQLPGAEQRLMHSLFRDGHTVAETAKLVGRTETQVVVTLSKGIAALRQIRRDLASAPGGGEELARFLKDAAASIKSEARK